MLFYLEIFSDWQVSPFTFKLHLTPGFDRLTEWSCILSRIWHGWLSKQFLTESSFASQVLSSCHPISCFLSILISQLSIRMAHWFCFSLWGLFFLKAPNSSVFQLQKSSTSLRTWSGLLQVVTSFWPNFVLVLFHVAVIKYTDKGNLREKEFI